MGFDRTKFSFKETLLNTNGKTSSTKLIGMVASMMCVILFTTMVIFYMFNVAESAVVIVLVDKIIAFFGVTSGLLGVKAVTASFGTNNKIVINNTDEKVRDDDKHHRRDYDDPDDCDGQ